MFTQLFIIFNAAPSAPPHDVSYLTLSSTSIQVIWNEVPFTERNGIITGYQVEYKQLAFEGEDINEVVVSAPILTTTLVNLHEYTEYTIRVRAFTVIGSGPYSNETMATTLQDSKYK